MAQKRHFGELGITLPEAEQSPDSVTFKHLSEWTVRTILAQSCPKLRARNVSHFIDIATNLHQMRNVHSEVANLSALFRAPIERLKGTWTRAPKSRRRTFRTLWELLCCPHETDMDTVMSKMEEVLSSKPFHQSVCVDHLRGHLTGRALDWVEVLVYRVVEEKATDYAHLKQGLTEQFPVVRNRSELETRFYASSEKHNQKPSDFVYDLLNIHKILKLEMTEEKLIDHIISRLESQLLDYVEITDNSRPRREFNRFESQGVADNRRFDGRRRGGQSDNRFHNQGGRQGGSRNNSFRGKFKKDELRSIADELKLVVPDNAKVLDLRELIQESEIYKNYKETYQAIVDCVLEEINDRRNENENRLEIEKIKLSQLEHENENRLEIEKIKLSQLEKELEIAKLHNQLGKSLPLQNENQLIKTECNIESLSTEFYQYFSDGMSPIEAIRFHENKFLLEDNFMGLVNASINPTHNQIYYLHKCCRDANLGSSINPFDKLKEKVPFYESIGKF
ncbi:uncharacterized protein TNCV_4780111 [Trichonephila clavipes]|nr:uncharacterized protein TNCV_4780111 [Trichonephila clavipes]